MPETKKKELSFEEAFRKLEAIVEILEKGESTLDEATKAFEEGMQLVEICSNRLNEAETRLQKLVKSEDGDFQLELIRGD
jgi:exodeoxyribonuclease VII small subunit